MFVNAGSVSVVTEMYLRKYFLSTIPSIQTDVSELIQTQDGAQTENESASTAEILRRFIWRFILGLVLSALPLLVVSWGGVMECSLPLVILTGVVGLPDDADRRGISPVRCCSVLPRSPPGLFSTVWRFLHFR